MPNPEDKITAFYNRNKAIQFDFSAGAVSSEGGSIILAAIEKRHKGFVSALMLPALIHQCDLHHELL